MTAPGWTPGPWHYEGESEHGWIVTIAPKRTISVEGRSAEEADANARLISAAPELYAALEACSGWMREHGCVPPCLSDAERALARARGERAS